jgi:hypothetical protein
MLRDFHQQQGWVRRYEKVSEVRLGRYTANCNEVIANVSALQYKYDVACRLLSAQSKLAFDMESSNREANSHENKSWCSVQCNTKCRGRGNKALLKGSSYKH